MWLLMQAKHCSKVRPRLQPQPRPPASAMGGRPRPHRLRRRDCQPGSIELVCPAFRCRHGAACAYRYHDQGASASSRPQPPAQRGEPPRAIGAPMLPAATGKRTRESSTRSCHHAAASSSAAINIPGRAPRPSSAPNWHPGRRGERTMPPAAKKLVGRRIPPWQITGRKKNEQDDLLEPLATAQASTATRTGGTELLEHLERVPVDFRRGLAAARLTAAELAQLDMRDSEVTWRLTRATQTRVRRRFHPSFAASWLSEDVLQDEVATLESTGALDAGAYIASCWALRIRSLLLRAANKTTPSEAPPDRTECPAVVPGPPAVVGMSRRGLGRSVGGGLGRWDAAAMATGAASPRCTLPSRRGVRRQCPQ